MATVKRLIVASKKRSRVVLSYLAAIRSHLDHEVIDSGPRVPLQTRLMGLMEDVGELARATREALADGEITDEERVLLLRAAETAQARLLGLTRELHTTGPAPVTR